MQIDKLKIKKFKCRLFILPPASALNPSGNENVEGEVNPMVVELTIQRDEGTNDVQGVHWLLRTINTYFIFSF